MQVAHDLTASLPSEERYVRLLEAARRVVASDAAALFRLRPDGLLHPLAVRGLSRDTLGRRFDPREQARLQAILQSPVPVRFPDADPRPDPFDGLIDHPDTERFDVHSCMGAALRHAGVPVGLLTFDALEPGRFDRADLEAVAGFASLAASAIHTAELIERLQQLAESRGQLAQDLAQDELRRFGGTLIGRSAATSALEREIDTVAPSDLTVLLMGETGTGKELAARSVHNRSSRRDRPLVYVNCAALPESVAESELFGHEEGAFTGASRRRLGKFQLADGATIFLDEVGELPLSIQTKILRTLQFQEVQPVGSDELRRVDVRVIAATNRRLEEEARRGRFRLDLYHRLAVFPIHLAPLRERREDVALLAGHFLDQARLKLGVGRMRFTPEAIRRLEAHDWPGNVRELEHVVTRAVLRAGKASGDGTTTVSLDHLHEALGPAAPHPAEAQASQQNTASPASPAASPPGDLTLKAAVEHLQRTMVRDALARADGRWAPAARALGLDRGNLQRLARRLGLR